MSKTDNLSLFNQLSDSKGRTDTARGVTLRQRTAAYDRANSEAATIILKTPVVYGGMSSGLCQWAYSWWLNHRRTRRAA